MGEWRCSLKSALVDSLNDAQESECASVSSLLDKQMTRNVSALSGRLLPGKDITYQMQTLN